MQVHLSDEWLIVLLGWIPAHFQHGARAHAFLGRFSTGCADYTDSDILIPLRRLRSYDDGAGSAVATRSTVFGPHGPHPSAAPPGLNPPAAAHAEPHGKAIPCHEGVSTRLLRSVGFEVWVRSGVVVSDSGENGNEGNRAAVGRGRSSPLGVGGGGLRCASVSGMRLLMSVIHSADGRSPTSLRVHQPSCHLSVLPCSVDRLRLRWWKQDGALHHDLDLPAGWRAITRQSRCWPRTCSLPRAAASSSTP
jgi:hypothetical protein